MERIKILVSRISGEDTFYVLAIPLTNQLKGRLEGVIRNKENELFLSEYVLTTSELIGDIPKEIVEFANRKNTWRDDCFLDILEMDLQEWEKFFREYNIRYRERGVGIWTYEIKNIISCKPFLIEESKETYFCVEDLEAKYIID